MEPIIISLTNNTDLHCSIQSITELAGFSYGAYKPRPVRYEITCNTMRNMNHAIDDHEERNVLDAIMTMIDDMDVSEYRIDHAKSFAPLNSELELFIVCPELPDIFKKNI